MAQGEAVLRVCAGGTIFAYAQLMYFDIGILG